MISIIICEIKFSFKKDYLEVSKVDSFYKFLTYNLIYIKLNIGNPKQEINVYLNMDKHPFFVSSIKGNGIYNEKKSNTFKLKSNETKFIGEGLSNGTKAEEIFYLNNNIILKDFPFVLAFNITDDCKYSLNIIGLKIKPYYSFIKEENFLYQLKKQKIISSYIYTIKYLNDNEGEFIIGNYPHEYDSNFKKENFNFIKGNAYDDFLSWETEFDIILYDNISIKEIKTCIFTNDFGGFIVTKDFQKILNESYFNKYFNNNQCIYQKHYYISYSSYICDRNIDIKNFKDIYFVHKILNMTFIFNYLDLFKLIDNKYYFMITFSNSEKETWKLGEPFFKKYQIIFDQENKIFGFYVDNIKKNNSLIPLFLIIILLFILLFLLLYYRKFLFSKSRKIRINEIDENIEYNIIK